MYAKEGDVRITKDNKVIELLGKFYNNPVDLIDLKHNRGYVQYAYTQAKKYGIRGSRMNVLESVKKFFLNKIQKK